MRPRRAPPRPPCPAAAPSASISAKTSSSAAASPRRRDAERGQRVGRSAVLVDQHEVGRERDERLEVGGEGAAEVGAPAPARAVAERVAPDEPVARAQRAHRLGVARDQRHDAPGGREADLAAEVVDDGDGPGGAKVEHDRRAQREQAAASRGAIGPRGSTVDRGGVGSHHKASEGACESGTSVGPGSTVAHGRPRPPVLPFLVRARGAVARVRRSDSAPRGHHRCGTAPDSHRTSPHANVVRAYARRRRRSTPGAAASRRAPSVVAPARAAPPRRPPPPLTRPTPPGFAAAALRPGRPSPATARRHPSQAQARAGSRLRGWRPRR
jgi:hypothetical protein